ncbi:MAG TPA: tRNA 2-thiouridine(34) synthase MnmA [Candidatus Paceibacterota bacterium]|nr:tRNA 2-thiouridine(34) synthase MnmA [Candidatus Paceibacterota bacterium]
MNLSGTRVFVGLSGGVDSAVTAALLKDAEAEVVGVFIKGWYPPGMPCTWAADRRDAMRVAAALNIPFHTLDASAEYRRSVIEYLLAEYRAGRTPNPDIMCNREVKFGAFYRFARERGADLIATGHYAQVVEGKLFRGSDEAKDQSYFLWAVPSETLMHTVFPLGAQTKGDTRSLARRHRLPVATKKDSQGICFLGSISVEDFLRSEFGEEPGEARDAKGRVIGRHNGALLHTIGERLSLTGAVPGPWYVVGKDIETNVLIVSRTSMVVRSDPRLRLTETNWLAEPGASETLTAQYRYHGPEVRGTLAADRTYFTPADPLPEAIAPGQSLVVYRGNQCIGGGIIG